MIRKVKALPAIFFNLINGSTLVNLRQQWQLARTLRYFLKNELTTYRPFTVHFYPYISRCFKKAERGEIVIHHYKFLRAAFSLQQLKLIFNDSVTFFTEAHGPHVFTIRLGTNTDSEYEGPLSLYFEADGRLVSKMSFAFFPGQMVGRTNENLIFISHLQRFKNKEMDNEKFNLFFRNIHPSAVILKAIEAVGALLTIDGFLCVNAKNQLSYHEDLEYSTFLNAYDNFWQERGAIATGDFFFLELPLKDIPILRVKQPHRNKTIKRRERLKAVYENCYACFQRFKSADGGS